jgi:hypothetical protein
VLTALSLSAANPFWTEDCDTCDWLRTAAAAVTIALSEAPHWAVAVMLKATISTDKAAILTPGMVWIVLNIPIPLLFAKFRQFMSSSFATDISSHDLRFSDLVNLISSSFVIEWWPRPRPNLAHARRLLLFFALLTNAQNPNAQIARGTSNGSCAGSSPHCSVRAIRSELLIE